MMKNLENPFSIAWSKLAALTQFISTVEEEAGNDTQSSEEPQTDQFLDGDEYVHVTDWIEPSIYFTIFCAHKRF
ncbi:MAG: hypothetical protein AAF915_25610 [Cyanobacteria bacterium P01_D01_bin.50]